MATHGMAEKDKWRGRASALHDCQQLLKIAQIVLEVIDMAFLAIRQQPFRKALSPPIEAVHLITPFG